MGVSLEGTNLIDKLGGAAEIICSGIGLRQKFAAAKSGRSELDRRKFRSETSDNMDSWKSRGGKRQRGEEKK